jgi:hypothetical protein
MFFFWGVRRHMTQAHRTGLSRSSLSCNFGEFGISTNDRFITDSWCRFILIHKLCQNQKESMMNGHFRYLNWRYLLYIYISHWYDESIKMTISMMIYKNIYYSQVRSIKMTISWSEKKRGTTEQPVPPASQVQTEGLLMSPRRSAPEPRPLAPWRVAKSCNSW